MPDLFAPLLHFGGDGYPEGFLHSAWSPEPMVVLGAFALIAGYIAITGPLNRRRPGIEERPVRTGQTVAFIAGTIALLIALGPPLDDWAGSYLLSAHMFQHLVLMFLVAPLWLIGLPAWFFQPLTRRSAIDRIGRAITSPVVAFVLANLIVTVWHLPGTYDAALRNEPVHVFQHLCFILAAVLAWWPILGPIPTWPRLNPLVQCLYLFLQTIPGGVVGAFVTLAEPGLYEPYKAAPRLWGISLATDQEIAGLLMWVLTSAIYLLLITIIFFRWAAREEAGTAEQPPVGGLPAPARR